jgi:aspartate aminotransferase
MKIASRVSKIETSKTIQVKEKALQMKARGFDVVDLTAGEPDFRTPENACSAGITAIKDGFTYYTANTGIPELREAIAKKLKNDNHLEYNIQQIIVSNGAKQCILNALLALVEEGDEVVFGQPYWVSYPEQVKIAGATPVAVDTSKNNFKLSPELLDKYITSKTRVVILNSPSNPTGVVLEPKEIEAIAAYLQNHNIWIITDEIYEKIIFDNIKHVSIATFGNLSEKCLVINGVSKSYAMTGWRIGYAAGPVEVIKAMSKIQSHYTSNPASISQKAALAAITGPQGEIEHMRQTFEKRRDYIRSRLDSHPYFSYVFPQGAFYFFINVSKAYGCKVDDIIIDNSVKFCTYLTEKSYLVTVPGSGFGADEYIRFSYAASQADLEKGMDRLITSMDEMVSKKMI